MWHQTNGIPVEGFDPSPEGPPRPLDTPPFGWREGVNTDLPRPPKRLVSYHPVTLPPTGSLRRSRTSGCVATAFLGLAVVLVAGVVAALVSQNGWFGLTAHSRASPGAGTERATAAAFSSTCPRVSTYTLQIPARIDQVEMTTGLRDGAHDDYRPVDDVRSFHAGERGYITFRIATDQAGTISLRFCLPSRMIVGTLPVPSNSQGRFGEFGIDFAGEDIGHGKAILYWGTLENGVSAIVDFTVSAT